MIWGLAQRSAGQANLAITVADDSTDWPTRSYLCFKLYSAKTAIVLLVAVVVVVVVMVVVVMVVVVERAGL